MLNFAVKLMQYSSLFRGFTKCEQTRSIFNFLKTKDFGKCSLVQKGVVAPERLVPDHIIKPHYYYELTEPSSTAGPIEIKSQEEIQGMRESCKLAANILNQCGPILKVGLTSDEIDGFVHDKIIQANAYPSPLRYGGFPKSVCTSINNVACHGIPDDRPLHDGDIINIDITTYYNGYHGDCSKTFLVGNVDEIGQFLVKITKECLDKAISVCGPRKPYSIIGKTIEDHARNHNLAVVPAFIGHGIGKYFHGPPEILHFENEDMVLMMPGTTFTIEPILTLGGVDIEIQDDMWTAITVDNARTAQFEHTILITESGVEILTIPD